MSYKIHGKVEVTSATGELLEVEYRYFHESHTVEYEEIWAFAPVAGVTPREVIDLDPRDEDAVDQRCRQDAAELIYGGARACPF